jgi:hypothetical protein
VNLQAVAAATACLFMKPNLRVWFFLGLAAAGTLGCNWAQIFAFRAQMRAVTENTAWEGADQEVLVFKHPLLTLDDLDGVHVYPEIIDEQTAVLRYRRVDAPPGTTADFEIRLLFVGRKLSGVVFPHPLLVGLGKGNIVGFFGMMGGEGFPNGAGVGPVPKSELVSANLFPTAAEPLGREVEVLLLPSDTRNRPIYIKMTERPAKPGYYSECLISFKERPK